MKLNCDMGESYGAWQMGDDAALMPYIDMVNIACGFHAADPNHMAKTVALANQHSVTIGAHPGYPDLQGFGRREMALSNEEICWMVSYQIGALQAICQAQDTQVAHIKPHGALYNVMMRDENVFSVLLETVARLQDAFSAGLALMVLAGKTAESLKPRADKLGVALLFEVFCDRAYQDDGHLVPRNVNGAILNNDAMIEARVEGLIRKQEITAINGKKLHVTADTICVHGDHSDALAAVKKVREYIARA